MAAPSPDGRDIPYPAPAAVLFTLPFLIDIAGNALNLYHQIDVFDDVCHFLNWALMCSAVGLGLLTVRSLPAWAVGALCVGFGATVAIAWEVGEYGAFVLNTPEVTTAYRDTIGDLALGLSGSIVAALVFTGLAEQRRRSAPTVPAAPAAVRTP